MTSAFVLILGVRKFFGFIEMNRINEFGISMDEDKEGGERGVVASFAQGESRRLQPDCRWLRRPSKWRKIHFSSAHRSTYLRHQHAKRKEPKVGRAQVINQQIRRRRRVQEKHGN